MSRATHRIAGLSATVHRISPSVISARLRVGFTGEHVPVREIVDWHRQDILVCCVMPSIVATRGVVGRGFVQISRKLLSHGKPLFPMQTGKNRQALLLWRQTLINSLSSTCLAASFSSHGYLLFEAGSV